MADPHAGEVGSPVEEEAGRSGVGAGSAVEEPSVEEVVDWSWPRPGWSDIHQSAAVAVAEAQRATAAEAAVEEAGSGAAAA